MHTGILQGVVQIRYRLSSQFVLATLLQGLQHILFAHISTQGTTLLYAKPGNTVILIWFIRFIALVYFFQVGNMKEKQVLDPFASPVGSPRHFKTYKSDLVELPSCQVRFSGIAEVKDYKLVQWNC